MADRDDIDPSDWLASQFDDGPEPKKPAQPPATPPPAYVPPPMARGAAPSPAEESAGGFVWGLTPGGGGAAPVQPPPPQPIPNWPATVLPPATLLPPAMLPPATAPTPPAAPTQPPSGVAERWAYDPLEQATRAIEQPPSVFEQPPSVIEQPTNAIERAQHPWEMPAVDYSMQGATDVYWAEPIGLADPVGEGVEASAIDSLFGDTQFREYDDGTIASARAFSQPTRSDAAPPQQPGQPGQPREPGPPREPMPRTQKILLWVAGSLVALLALVAMFLVGSRLAPNLRPAPVAVPSAEATATPGAPGPGLGPLAPGEYTWSELRGGECLDPWESAWQDSYDVVDCATPHRAQLVFRGVFDDPAGTLYPGVEALQARTLPLCSAPTAIDFAAAAGAADLQISASYAGDEEEWLAGNPSFFCFVSRAGGEPLTGSLAVQAVVQ